MNTQKLHSSEDVIKLNRADWNKMPIQHMHIDTNLIKCYKLLFPLSKNKKLLYIGFGEGQNLLYFLSEGFECYGTEISINRIKHVNSELKKSNQKATIQLVDSCALPFAENFFDVVVAWQSIYYNDKKGLENTLQEVRRVLKPDGHFLSAMISAKHDLCGREVAPSTFNTRVPSQRHCIIYAFNDKKQIKKMYKKFKRIEIGFYSFRLLNIFNHHYIIHCLK